MSYKPRLSSHMDSLLVVLASDYADYGGAVKRWEDAEHAYPDCSVGCRWYIPLEGLLGADWGVCAHAGTPRAGLLTFEHQAGFGCFEAARDADPFGEDEE
jgi:hypothetical protein